MDSGLLSLKWNNHSSTFFHVLETIRKKELYSDVTIACDGKFFSVHKLVLSTCSEYFQEMFERTQCKHPIIVLKDISYKDLESLLNYMYIGEVNVIQTELSSLIKAAECLRVKGLAVPDEPPLSQKKSNKRPNTNDKEDGSSSKRNRRSGSFSQNQSSTSSSKDDRGNVDTSSLSSSEMPSHPTLGGSKETESRLDNQSTNSYKEFETVVIKTEKEDANTENYVENDLPPISKFEYEGAEPVENESNVNQRLDDGSESSFSSHQQQQQSADDSMGHLMPSTSGFQGESSSWGSEMEGMEEGNKERGEGGSYDPNSTYLIDNSQGKAQVGELKTSHSAFGKGISKLMSKNPFYSLESFDEKHSGRSLDLEVQLCSVLNCPLEIFAACSYCSSLICLPHLDETPRVCCKFAMNKRCSGTGLQSEFIDSNYCSSVSKDSIEIKNVKSRQSFSIATRKFVKPGDLIVETSKNFKIPKVCGDYCNKTCFRNCKSVTSEQRQNIMNFYWSLKNVKERRDFLIQHVLIVGVKQRIVNEEISRRGRTLKYFLTINPPGLRVEVCKVFFLSTLGISDRQVRTALSRPNS